MISQKMVLYLLKMGILLLIGTSSNIYTQEEFATQVVLAIIDNIEPSIAVGQIIIPKKIKIDIAHCVEDVMKKHYPKGSEKRQKSIAKTFSENVYKFLDITSLENSLTINATNYWHQLSNFDFIEDIVACKNTISIKPIYTKKKGAMAEILLCALIEEESIIITTSSVVHYLMSYLQELSLTENPLNLNPAKKINPDHWIIKKITNYFYLIIPKEYIKTRSNYSHIKKTEEYTQRELTLGLKFERLKEISSIDFMNPKTHPDKYSYKIDISDHFVDSLKSICIPQQFYTIFEDEKNPINVMPRSVIVIAGHGSEPIDEKRTIKQTIENIQNSNDIDEEVRQKDLTILKEQLIAAKTKGGIIAGLSSISFGKLVAFLVKNVNVSLLFFNTCYGAETNIQKSLETTAQQLEQNFKSLFFPFPIISGGISTAPTITMTRIKRSRDYIFIHRPNFKLFLDTLNKKQQPSKYKSASEKKTLFLHKNYPSESQISNALGYIYGLDPKLNHVPIIKYKDLPWRTLDIRNFIINIDEVLAQTRDKNNPLDISTFFKRDTRQEKIYPDIIAIKAQNVPFVIKLMRDFDYAPDIISTIPGNSFQMLAGIDASNVSLQYVLKSFMPMLGLAEYKIFNIKKLIVLDTHELLDKENLGKNITLTNVWAINGPDQHIILFKYNNICWFVDLNKGDVLDNLKEISYKEFNKIFAALPEIIQKQSRDLTEIKNLKFKKPKTEEEVEKEMNKENNL